MVGTSGAAAERVAPVMATAFSAPLFTCGSADSMVSNMMGTWPPITSCSAGALPL
jgi:hypothetical protein